MWVWHGKLAQCYHKKRDDTLARVVELVHWGFCKEYGFPHQNNGTNVDL